jgi:hypothetical protein
MDSKHQVMQLQADRRVVGLRHRTLALTESGGLVDPF